MKSIFKHSWLLLLVGAIVAACGGGNNCSNGQVSLNNQCVQSCTIPGTNTQGGISPQTGVCSALTSASTSGYACSNPSLVLQSINGQMACCPTQSYGMPQGYGCQAPIMNSGINNGVYGGGVYGGGVYGGYCPAGHYINSQGVCI